MTERNLRSDAARVVAAAHLDGPLLLRVVAGRMVQIGQASVWGGRNVPAQMPGPASKLYAQNLINLVTLMTAQDEEGTASFAPDPDDEIIAGSCVTRDGAILHEPTRQALEGDLV